MFGQAKQINKSSSSLKANHVITNFLIRIHEEATAQANPLVIQEDEIHNTLRIGYATVGGSFAHVHWHANVEVVFCA